MRSWFKRKKKGEAPDEEPPGSEASAGDAVDDDAVVAAPEDHAVAAPEDAVVAAPEDDEVIAAVDDVETEALVAAVADDEPDAAPSLGQALVVEDDPDAAEVCAQMLRDLGWTATAIPSAELALRHLRTDPPDLLLVDLHLKGMDGFGLLDNARTAMPTFESMRILAVSGVYTDSSRMRVQLVRRGVSRLLAKPFSSAQLAAAIEAAGPAGELEDWSWEPSESGTFHLTPNVRTERASRYRCRAEALVFGAGGAEQAVLAEISRTGCRLVAERFPWDSTSEVRVRPRFDLPGYDEAIRPTMECEVVWSRELLPGLQEIGLRVLRCQPEEAMDAVMDHLAATNQETWPGDS